MKNETTPIKKPISWYFITAVTSALFLNVNAIHFQPLAVWARVLIPLLFAVGLVGSTYRLIVLRLAGWVGILTFFVVTIAASFPSEDYVLGLYSKPGQGPPEVGAFEIGF